MDLINDSNRAGYYAARVTSEWHISRCRL